MPDLLDFLNRAQIKSSDILFHFGTENVTFTLVGAAGDDKKVF
jgi:hypothetical protein